MQAFHIPGAAPLYTNTFLLISDAGHAVVIDPAAEVDSYDEILKQHNATLTTILCTHGHYDHVGSAEALRTEWNAKLYCEAADLAGDRMYPLSAADCGYAEGETVSVDELQFTVWHTPGHTPGGVVLLWNMGSYPVALVIFVASVLVPIAKILSLFWLCYTVSRGDIHHKRGRTRLYRLTEFVGRWSMVDVFVVAVLAALIRMGKIMSIYPGIAAMAFAGVVVVTMIAAMLFDPRLIWDRSAPPRI